MLCLEAEAMSSQKKLVNGSLKAKGAIGSLGTQRMPLEIQEDRRDSEANEATGILVSHRKPWEAWEALEGNI